MAADIRLITNPHATVYKLTDANMRTYGRFQWALEVPHVAPGKGPLCSAGWLHAYSHPDIAVLLNSIHATIRKPRLFEARVSGMYLSDKSLKVGVSEMTLVQELPVPTFTLDEYVAWSIFMLREIPNRPSIPAWEAWASNVLTAKTTTRGDVYFASRSAYHALRDVDYYACIAYDASLTAYIGTLNGFSAEVKYNAAKVAWYSSYAEASRNGRFSLIAATNKFKAWRASRQGPVL